MLIHPSNRWVPPTSSGTHALEHALSLTTYAHMTALAASSPSAGITLMKGIEYLEAPPLEYSALDPTALRLPGDFRLLQPAELPTGVTWGCEYDTWSLNPMVYCCFLLRRFVVCGGRIRRRELAAVVEVFAIPARELGWDGDSPTVVVNASGFGLDPDPDMFITRGQTCVVANQCDVTVTRQNADGSWSFCVPRGFDGGTVIGGTREPENWESSPSVELREKLLETFAVTYPSILGAEGKFTVIADIVGRRPTRKGGPRIEGEVLDRDRFVMHAYGLGGRGYELSWGVAKEVVETVDNHLRKEADPV